MDLSVSDVIRLVLIRVAEEGKLPFEVKTPNATTRRAIAELEDGKGKRFKSMKALLADLHD
jgi:DNA-damage-inducible protein J